jgi:cellulose synthase/poly-beta-1,6-N-acetylglucosamine synthase-like glycosyltransferase
MPWWSVAIVVFGVNFVLWASVGLARLLEETWATRTLRGRLRRLGLRRGPSMTVQDVAVLIPAHNEEMVIEASIAAIAALVPRCNVHVVSDGSTDRTAELARRTGVNVIETRTNVGKAGALEEAIERFGLVQRFRAVLLLDADTTIEPGYFDAALPHFDDPQVVAVAGAVRTHWHGRALSMVGKVLVCHRERIYAISQRLLKFGQTWRFTNATHIVPGFASMYRTAVLPQIEMNPPGLVIEDFNMTFEIYQKRLGKVGFTLGAVAVTQDPDNFHDYVRQTRRWALGLWQTVRRHRLRPNFFSAMLALLLGEMVVSSVVFLLVPVLLLVLGLPALVGGAAAWPVFGPVYLLVSSHMTLSTVFYGVILPDLAMTIIAAAVDRQPVMLLFAAFFPLLRVLDAALGLAAIPLIFRTESNGRWKSPARQAALRPLPPLAPLPPAMAATEPIPVIRVPDEPLMPTADRAGQPVMIAGLPYQARPEPNPVAAGNVGSPEPVSPQYAGDGPHASG